RQIFMSIRLNWLASASASCFYAAGRLAAAKTPVTPQIADALNGATTELVRFLVDRKVAVGLFFEHLIPAAASIAGNRDLARMALVQTAGRDRAETLLELTAGLLTSCEQAYFQAFPDLVAELELRSRPLRELWEAGGPGMLVGAAKRTDRRLLVEEATI